MVKKGSVGLTEQPPDSEFTPGNGWSSVRVFHGTKTAVMTQAALFATQGFRVSTRSLDGPIYELRAVSPTVPGITDTTVNTWLLLGADQQTDVKLHPYFDEVTTTQMEVIDQKLDNPDSVEIAGDLPRELYDFLRRGQNVFQQSRYVLRYTQTSSSNTSASISVTGVDKLWTEGQIISAHGGMPANIQAAINSIPAPGSKVGYLWRWLKSASQLEKVLNQKTVISIDWKLDLWPTALYANA